MARRPSRREIKPPADLAAALDIAYRYLATRPRTRLEVARRLRRAGAEDEVIEGSLARLEAAGYIDDAAFIRYWTEQRDMHSPRAARLIEVELRQRGIGRELIESARESAPPVRTADAASTDARRADTALARHLRGRTLEAGNPRELKRALDFLARRGFSHEASRRALEAVIDRSRSGDLDPPTEDHS